MKPLVGMMIVIEQENRAPDVWTISRVREPRKDGSVSITLIAADWGDGDDAPFASAEAAAVLPNGVIEAPFRVFRLSPSDRRQIWERSA